MFRITFFCVGFFLSMFFFTTAIFGQNLSDSVKVKEWVEFAKKNYNKAAFLQESSQKAHEALLLARKIRYKKGEVQALLALEALASHQNKTEESLDYAEKAIFLSKDSPLKGEYAHAIYAKAYTSYLRGMHKEALELYQNSLKIRLEINDKSGAATCYNSIGNLYNTKGDYQNAIAYYLKAAELREIENDISGVAAIYNNLGNVNFNLGYTDQALEFFQKSLSLKEKINDKKGIAGSMLNISTVYKRKKDFNKSLHFQFKAMKIQEEINDLRGLAVNFNNLATYYSQLPNYDSAIIYYRKSLKIREEIKEVNGKLITMLGIGNTYMKLKMLDSTLFYCQEVEKIAQKIGAHKELRDAYRLLADYHYLKEDFKASLENYRKHTLIKDSLLGEEKTAQINKIQEAFSKLQSEKENEILRKENALKQADLEREALEKEQLSLQAAQEKQNSLLLLSENKIKETELKNAQLESEKNQKELLVLHEQKSLQQKELAWSNRAMRFQQFFIAAAVLLIAVVLFFAVHFRKSRNKLYLQNEEIIIKSNEITLQKEMIENIAENLKEAYDLISEKNKQIEEKNHNFTASVNYAKRIQTAILPETKVILNYAKDYAVFWKPRDIVSGDFYWICEIVENQQKNLIVALADCTGHGVPGAFMSMIGNDLLNAIIIEKRIFSPENILEELDREIRKVLRQDATQSRDGMDIAVCKIIPDEKIVEFAGAKQPFYAFTNDGCEILIAGSKRNVGGMDLLKHQPFEKNIISYTDGLTFYLYSDGFQDQFGGKFPFSKFKSKPFREMLKKHHLRNFEDQMNTWEKILQDFTEENPNQTDDILILGIKL